MKSWKGMLAGAVLSLLVGVAVGQTNMSPNIGSGTATAILTQKHVAGALPYISVVGAKTVLFQFQVAGSTIDSLNVRLEASADTTKGWTILDNAVGYTKITAAGNYSYYTDTADVFRYFRMFFVKDTADTTGRINNVTCKAGWPMGR